MISKKYDEILNKLKENIEDKRDFNLAKSALSDLAICYADSLEKITENYHLKISSFESRLLELEKKVIEDIDDTENNTIVEGIACPYCGFEFNVKYDDSQNEISCPECNNLIELDWGEFEDDM